MGEHNRIISTLSSMIRRVGELPARQVVKSINPKVHDDVNTGLLLVSLDGHVQLHSQQHDDAHVQSTLGIVGRDLRHGLLCHGIVGGHQ